MHYVVEVDLTPDRKVFVSKGGRLTNTPYFWKSAGRLREIFSSPVTSSITLLNPQAHLSKTTVIKVDNLQNGLRGASAVRMTAEEFMKAHDAKTLTRTWKHHVFKLRIPVAEASAIKHGVNADGFIKVERERFGKIWQSSGALRNHLTRNSPRFNLRGKGIRSCSYENAEVYIYEVNPLDGSMFCVKQQSALSFLLESPYSKAVWERKRSVLGRTQQAKDLEWVAPTVECLI